jgi:iron complex outermembrane recepter protein
MEQSMQGETMRRCLSMLMLNIAVSTEYQAQATGESSTAPVAEDRLPMLAPVVVTATRVGQSSADLPVSINVIGQESIRQANAMVNLSETLVRAPGVVVQNRQNYAQDLQISVRGFGARSAFGVRGVRLYADGISATTPDDQG